MLSFQTPLSQLIGIGPETLKRLKNLGLEKVEDLIFYFPRRYDDFSTPAPIFKLRIGETQTIAVKIDAIKNERSPKRRMIITHAKVSDPSGQLNLVWFNQPYLEQTLRPGTNWIFYGKITWDFSSQRKMMASPLYEKEVGILPIYSETEKLSSKFLRRIIKPLLKIAAGIPDYFSADFLGDKKLIPLGEALQNIHFPRDFEALEKARERLSFDELFFWNLRLQLAKKDLISQTAPTIKIDEKLLKKFTAGLPYQLTNAQRKAAWEIILDLKKSNPMNRLLEGDVGSGKTVVAAMAALAVGKNGLQTIWLAPTEILAIQHYENVSKMLEKFGLKIALVTAKNKKLDGEKLTGKNLAEKINEADLIIGTHALLTGKVSFDRLALIIVDEQHRFGVQQRAQLAARGLTQKDTRTNAENLLYEDITYEIRKAIFNVKKNLGLGHKEIIYQKALEEEFKIIGLNFEKEKSIEVKYNNKRIGFYKPDFLVGGKVILELKALPFIGNLEKRQVWNYLKGSNYKLIVLVNFGSEDIEIKRIVFDVARIPRESALSQRKPAFMVPHFLSMTATPIPRTLALAFFSDLDLSIIDEMPKGRQKVETKIIPPEKRQSAYDFIAEQIKKGRQVFVVCPLIQRTEDPSTTLRAGGRQKTDLFGDERKTVLEEYERLSKKIFPQFRVAYLHGKMKAAEKEKIMASFKDGKYDILVSTSVIEVGVDVPNATVIMIEGAERFGLAQLHQFRGRVGRGEHQAFCFLFVEIWSKKIADRLRAFVKNHDGFKLAEEDLKLRGPGDLIGTMQSGIPEFKIASLGDVKMIEKSKRAAEEITAAGIDNFPKIKQKLSEFYLMRHLE